MREVLSLHFQASRRRDEILDEAKSLQAAGKVREARKRRKQADEMTKLLRALADNCRLPAPDQPG
jgi:hypothetical protein